MKKKYIAIKVKGYDHWLWFEKPNVRYVGGKFIGEKGWGKHGTYIDVNISESDITSKIESTGLSFS